MDAYKIKLKKQNIAMMVCMVFMLLLYLLMWQLPGADGMEDTFHGYCAGFITALEMLLIVGIIRNRRAIGNDELLRKQYIRRTDERDAQIRQRMDIQSLSIVMVGLSAAIIIAGNYNKTIFMTLVATLYFILLVTGGAKIYNTMKLR